MLAKQIIALIIMIKLHIMHTSSHLRKKLIIIKSIEMLYINVNKNENKFLKLVLNYLIKLLTKLIKLLIK